MVCSGLARILYSALGSLGQAECVQRPFVSVSHTSLSLFGLYKDIFFFLITATPQPQSHLTSVSLDESDIFLGVDGRKGRGRKKKGKDKRRGFISINQDFSFSQCYVSCFLSLLHLYSSKCSTCCLLGQECPCLPHFTQLTPTHLMC